MIMTLISFHRGLISLVYDGQILSAKENGMADFRQLFGRSGEALALEYLKKNGYRIVTCNYRAPMGEIDIIATDQDTLVFAEVKTRKSARFGDPKWALTPKKKRTLSMVALFYLKSIKKGPCKARFDVVSIYAPQTGDWKIEIIKNAFELAYS